MDGEANMPKCHAFWAPRAVRCDPDRIRLQSRKNCVSREIWSKSRKLVVSTRQESAGLSVDVVSNLAFYTEADELN